MSRGTAERVIRELRLQEEESHFPATRSAGLNMGCRLRHGPIAKVLIIDWVVGTLLHDIGDGLAPQNHDRFAAEILRPYMREEVVWTVEHHALVPDVLLCPSLRLEPARAREVPRLDLLPVLRRVLRTLGSVVLRSRLSHRDTRISSCRWCARSSPARPMIQPCVQTGIVKGLPVLTAAAE